MKYPVVYAKIFSDHNGDDVHIIQVKFDFVLHSTYFTYKVQYMPTCKWKKWKRGLCYPTLEHQRQQQVIGSGTWMTKKAKETLRRDEKNQPFGT